MHIMWICKEAKCGRPTTNPDETWWSHICNLDHPKAARFSATEIDIWIHLGLSCSRVSAAWLYIYAILLVYQCYIVCMYIVYVIYIYTIIYVYVYIYISSLSGMFLPLHIIIFLPTAHPPNHASTPCHYWEPPEKGFCHAFFWLAASARDWARIYPV